jgi:hypothetical protein
MRWLNQIHDVVAKTFDILDLVVQRLKNLTIQITKLTIHTLFLALALLGALGLLYEHPLPSVRPAPPAQNQNGTETREPRKDVFVIPFPNNRPNSDARSPLPGTRRKL